LSTLPLGIQFTLCVIEFDSRVPDEDIPNIKISNERSNKGISNENVLNREKVCFRKHISTGGTDEEKKSAVDTTSNKKFGKDRDLIF
jgi:hypothetical protein